MRWIGDVSVLRVLSYVEPQVTEERFVSEVTKVISVLSTFKLITEFTLHSFLSVTNPIDTTLLVVEDWIANSSLLEAGALYLEGGYELLITVGIEAASGVVSSEDPAYRVMMGSGISSSELQIIKHPPTGVHKTYRSATALKKWIEIQRPSTKAFNLVTETVHARKSFIDSPAKR